MGIFVLWEYSHAANLVADLAISDELALDDLKGTVRLRGPHHFQADRACCEICQLHTRCVSLLVDKSDFEIGQRHSEPIVPVRHSSELQFQIFVFPITSPFEHEVSNFVILALALEELLGRLKTEAESKMIRILSK